MKKYDIIVIGSGGGTKLVRPASLLGKRVAIVEKDKLGGTCLNRGCIPSKMLIHAADVALAAMNGDRYHLRTAYNGVDFSSLIQEVSKTIDQESDSIAPLYEKDPNIDLYRGHGHFIDHKVIAVGEEQLTAEYIVIATGAEASKPQIPGLDSVPYLTYREALRSTVLPKELIVLGGGFIACELGHFFGSLGADVSFVVRSKMLKKEDEDIREHFLKSFKSRFSVFEETQVHSIRNRHGRIELEIAEKDRVGVIDAERLLVATGVVPNTDDLGLEKTKIQRDERGFIRVNEHLMTAEKGVYALGDVVGHALFRHNANYEGEYLFSHLFKGNKAAMTKLHMPYAVFTSPQVAGIGLSEKDAKEQGLDVLVGKCPYQSSAMGMALKPEVGMVKLIFDRKDYKLVGAYAVGEEASNMIHMPLAYMQMGATLKDILKTIFIHPALPEIVRNAARDAGRQVNLYP